MHLGFVTLVIIMALSLRLLVTTRFVTETHSKTSWNKLGWYMCDIWTPPIPAAAGNSCCYMLLLFLISVVLCCLAALFVRSEICRSESSGFIPHIDSGGFELNLNRKYGEKTLSVIMKIRILGLFHEMELGLLAECGREHRTCSCNQTLVLNVWL